MHQSARMGRGPSRGVLLLLTVVVAALWFGVARASAADVLTNGSFETGDFTGWTATSPNTDCTLGAGDPWTVWASPSSGWCYSSFGYPFPTSIAAADGSHFADVSWDGYANGDPELSQQVTIPAATTDTLAWSDNTSWETCCFGGTEARVEYVDVLSGETLLHSFTIQTLDPGTTGATGWVPRSLDLSAYAGQTVEIRFRLTVPEFLTGPANFALDGVTLNSTPTEGYAGTPGQKKCVGTTTSALSVAYGGDLSAAAQALGFASVKALQRDIKQYCSS